MLTDFNDLHVAVGLDEVRRQLLAVLNTPSISAAEEYSPPISDEQPPIDAYANDSPNPSAQSAFSDDDDSEQRVGRYAIHTLLAKFWLVYGSDTVWDDINRIQMRLSHLRHAILRERFKAWEESPVRRIVRDIRFEPGVELSRESVNLYHGFEMQPDDRGESGCQLIRNHIFRLCSQREEEYFWLLNWMAYPLQNPGAKMASSVVMYGSEGPGKSIIWEQVIKRIYGEYGVTIGQAQLDSQFTGWQSRRLFALAEEVVNRAERSHHKGALKHVVTGSTLMINEKNLPLREESNHLNFVFLSNSTVPLELDYGDRRYFVLYCDQVPELQYFKDLFAEINSGGVECFYRYLLNLDLGEFGPHTKPPLNAEKQNLISASLSAPLYFLQEWQAGHLDFPYGCAQVSDLWGAFQRWSEQSNEFKRKRRDFEAEIRRRCAYERSHISYPTANNYTTQRFWVPPAAIDDRLSRQEYLKTAGDQCRAFADVLASSRAQQGRGE